MTGTVTSESILASIRSVMRDFGPPPLYDELRVGSLFYLRKALREKEPKDPRVGLPLTYAGFPVKVDPALPRHMAVLLGKPRRIFDDARIMLIDMRRRPWTDDMAQMLTDLGIESKS